MRVVIIIAPWYYSRWEWKPEEADIWSWSLKKGGAFRKGNGWMVKNTECKDCAISSYPWIRYWFLLAIRYSFWTVTIISTRNLKDIPFCELIGHVDSDEIAYTPLWICGTRSELSKREYSRNRWVRAVDPDDSDDDSDYVPVEGMHVSNLPWDPHPTSDE